MLHISTEWEARRATVTSGDGLGAMGILMGSLGDSVGVPPTTLWITNNNNDFFDDDILCHHG